MTTKKSIICFFVLFLTVYFLEAIGGFYMTSAVVAIEKQFQIPSRMSGLMVSAGDFGYIPSVVFVSYLGGKGNRAKWIGGGCILVAVANILISSSNFLFPVKAAYVNGSTIEERMRFENWTVKNSNFEGKLIDLNTEGLGNATDQNEKRYLHSVEHSESPEVSKVRILTSAPFAMCSNMLNGLRQDIEDMRCSRKPSNFGPFLMIFGGLLILGVGRTMPFSLGLPLMDDNVKKKNLPVYFAGMFFIRILGPVLGFVIGSIANKYYYAFDVPAGLSPRDPMWIGRWWAGFLLIGVVLFGPSLALYFFPNRPRRKASQQSEGEKKDKSVDTGANDNEKKSVKLEVVDGSEAESLKKPKRKRQRSLALVDRNVARDESGKTLIPTTFGGKVKGLYVNCDSFLKDVSFY
ncbi:hypothetical protein AB6A40_005768 [Gnathostoma spinigerum]|uniref:Solute carrier organic anion transporter family member n=1 Tax=Gnathostoma spinigerum TaxID=75299 RepID=A0ABD6ELN0_9BILA